MESRIKKLFDLKYLTYLGAGRFVKRGAMVGEGKSVSFVAR